MKNLYNKKIFKSLLFIVVYLQLVSCAHKDSSDLIIATSANMQFAMKEIIHAFESETGIQCQMITGSSGKLTAQIREHAPFDIFVSADMKYPELLKNSGFTYDKPVVYAYGKLVLWTADKKISPSFEILTQNEIRHIALANPKTAPYGLSAKEVLERKGLLNRLKKKLVYGESVSQTNQFILSGVANIGFTAKSVIMSPGMKGKGNWIDIDPEWYSPIVQGVVILKYRETHLEKAQKFRAFLFSARAHKILNTFGYSVTNPHKP